jgi:hypothetical protein
VKPENNSVNNAHAYSSKTDTDMIERINKLGLAAGLVGLPVAAVIGSWEQVVALGAISAFLSYQVFL